MNDLIEILDELERNLPPGELEAWLQAFEAAAAQSEAIEGAQHGKK